MHPSEADDLDFDEQNEAHLWERHQVTAHELVQVFRNDPVFVPNKRTGTARWLMLGDTDGGRPLTAEVICMEAQCRPTTGLGPHERAVGAGQVAPDERTMRFMDEHTVAEIEAEMDDHDAWGDPEDAPAPRRRSERRQRGAVVSVRLTEAELGTVQAYAAGRGLSVSGALRAATLEAAAGSQVVSVQPWHGGQVATATSNEASARVGTAKSDFAFAR